MRRPLHSGFIGLLGMLLTLLIIGYWIWSMHLTGPTGTAQQLGPGQIVPTEQDFNIIDSAKKAKQQLENSYHYSE